MNTKVFLQMPVSYIPEQSGNIQYLIDTFSSQRRYLVGYLSAVQTFSADDSFEAAHWMIHAGLAGTELAHVYPFRAKLKRQCELAGILDVQEFGERYEKWPLLLGAQEGGMAVNDNGVVSARCWLCVGVQRSNV